MIPFCKRLPFHTGQEQACSRITWLFVCLVGCLSPCRKWLNTQKSAVDSSQYSPLHCSRVYYSPPQPTTVQYSPLQASKAHYSSVQPSAVYCNPPQPSTVHYSAQCSSCQLGSSCSQNLPCSNYRRIICSCSYYLEHILDVAIGG